MKDDKCCERPDVEGRWNYLGDTLTTGVEWALSADKTALERVEPRTNNPDTRQGGVG